MKINCWCSVTLWICIWLYRYVLMKLIRNLPFKWKYMCTLEIWIYRNIKTLLSIYPTDCCLKLWCPYHVYDLINELPVYCFCHVYPWLCSRRATSRLNSWMYCNLMGLPTRFWGELNHLTLQLKRQEDQQLCGDHAYPATQSGPILETIWIKKGIFIFRCSCTSFVHL